MLRLFTLVLLAMSACNPPSEKPIDTGKDSPVDSVPIEMDEDGDGYLTSEGDCDDSDEDVSPAATEVCNGLDDDCDEAIDEDVQGTWYADNDGDGFGDPDTTESACDAPPGYVTAGTDCDDTHTEVWPGAIEVCDGLDNDCNGDIDDSVMSTWYTDADGDGYGDPGTAVDMCDGESGLVADYTDCDDTTASRFPGNAEVCDEIDNDCDSTVDEGVTTIYYADADGDGFGDEDDTLDACEVPAGYVENSDDCDDTLSEVNPDAAEVCDELDDDCDGDVDEDDALDAPTWYADADNDGYGDPDTSTAACEEPYRYVSDDTDCDDTDPWVHPGSTEYCDGEDDDCNGSVDDNAYDGDTWYADSDGDNYGDADVSTISCSQPTGYVSFSTDCDDTDADAYPGATETCNSIDDDCDGSVDEAGSTGATTWYADADGDGYGTSAATSTSCTQPSGYVSTSGDCDDTLAAVNPTATEVCDSDDNDCDGTTDESDASDASTWYRDADSDGYGTTGTTRTACTRPSGYVSDSTDCDDTDSGVSPADSEYCDGEDDDCDGQIDEASAVDADTWYYDGDGDGYGDTTPTATSCSQPTSYVDNNDDCDDGDLAISPGATEYCNGTDDDCDGTTDESSAADATTWYRDADSDGYGRSTTTSTSCSRPTGYVSNSTDCDDTDSGVYPGATEYCDSEDDDCDGTTDESAVDTTTYYRDVDRDGYGTSSTTYDSCTLPSGYVTNDDDCDDTTSAVSPADIETCNDIDDDCDGLTDESGATGATTYYYDADADGYGVSTTTTTACDAPSGYATVSGDCDDADATANPGESEVCDDVDNDCDHVVDDSATDATTWYRDADSDGYGASSPTSTACDQPTGYASVSGDCSDSNASLNPGETEICYNGLDEDCDSTADDGCPSYTSHCGTISASETWSSSTTHYVSCDVTVQGSASPTLTISDGATVVFAAGARLSVGNSSYGSLAVQGTTTGVTFTSVSTTPAAGDWDGIQIGTYNRTTSIDGATIEYAGGTGYGAVYGAACSTNSGTLDITDSLISDSSTSGVYVTGNCELEMSNTIVESNTTYGVYLSTSSSLETTGGPTFIDNVISDNGSYPIAVPAAYVDELDSSSSFAGNTTDRVYVYSGTVSADATWQALDVPYLLAGDITVQGSAAPTLTIEDGTTLRFSTGAALLVGYTSYGSLSAEGPISGITFTGSLSSGAAGDWDGIMFGAYTRTGALENVTVEYAGANGYGNIYLYNTIANSTPITIVDSYITDGSNSGIYLGAASDVTITGTYIAGNADYGVWLDSTSMFDDPFVDNVVTDNALYPVSLPANEVGDLDDSSSYVDNGTDYIRVTNDTVDTDQTWLALDVDYRITGDVYVQMTSTGASLIVSDGTSFYFDSGAGLFSGYSTYGEIAFQGTTTGITLTSSDLTSPLPGDWDGLWIGTYDTGTTIDGTTIAYGGNNGYGNVYVTNNSTYPLTITDSVITESANSGVYLYNNGYARISNTEISNNDDYGVYLYDASSGLSTSTSTVTFLNNEVTGNALMPIRLYASDVYALDDSSTYSGNTSDWIYITGDTIAASETWQNLDVDYYVLTDITVTGTASPVLTVDPGTTIEFARNAGMTFGTSTGGELYAVGTSALPITFTSGQTTPAAGDWDGLTFYNRDTGSTLQYATVAYGGTNTKGNLYFYYTPAGATVDNCTIAYSSTYGIYRQSATPTLTNITYTSNTSGTLY